MAKSAAMVQAKVVKGAGGGAEEKMTCEEILACFDPKIKFGAHDKMQGTKKGYQAEHIVPTAAMHKAGRSGPRVAGCSGYTTPKALTWMVRDRQKVLQEHKILTDAMRQFSQSNDLAGGREAPLKEWLDKYEEGTKKALKDGKPARKITNDKVDKDSLINAAAECIRARAEEAFAEMKPPVKPDTKLRNPWKATKEQRAAAASARASRGRRR
jgi:hypothetical protein